jgi:hypothetical protein
MMQDTSTVARKPDGDRPARRLVDDELADELLGKAQAEGVELLGPDGLLSQVTKAVLERALTEEMTGHLGYEKHDPAGRGSGNNRNGSTGKTVCVPVTSSRSCDQVIFVDHAIGVSLSSDAVQVEVDRLG